MAQDIWTVPETPSWAPLVAVLELYGIKHMLNRFMYIGQHNRPEGGPIEIYKHDHTRRCINIDHDLNTYAYFNEKETGAGDNNKAGYRKIPSKEAIRYAIT